MAEPSCSGTNPLTVSGYVILLPVAPFSHNSISNILKGKKKLRSSLRACLQLQTALGVRQYVRCIAFCALVCSYATVTKK